MATLLTIPRELRNVILDDVIHSRRPIPKYPGPYPTPWPADRKKFQDLDNWPGPTDGQYTPLSVYSEDTPTAFEPACSNLLRTCRQLRAETLEQESKANIPYRLDAVIINGERLWTTWLSMPIHRPSIIERLEINIRIAGALRNPANANIYDAIHPWHMVYLFERLLMRILAQGTHIKPLNHQSDGLKFLVRIITYLRPRFSIRYLSVHILSEGEVHRNNDEMVAGQGRDMLDLFRSRARSGLWKIGNPYDYYFALKRALHYELLASDYRGGLFRGPGGRVFRERIGGFRLECGEQEIGVENLSGVYEWEAEGASRCLAKGIRDILAAREKNGFKS